METIDWLTKNSFFMALWTLYHVNVLWTCWHKTVKWEISVGSISILWKHFPPPVVNNVCGFEIFTFSEDELTGTELLWNWCVSGERRTLSYTEKHINRVQTALCDNEKKTHCAGVWWLSTQWGSFTHLETLRFPRTLGAMVIPHISA